MTERPPDTFSPRPDGERESCPMSPAALGFPLVFVTLLLHGGGIFLVRQGLWLPSPAAETGWSALVITGVVVGVLLSIAGGWLGPAGPTGD